MEEILEALDQINGDLKKAIEIKKGSRYVVENGKPVKKDTTTANIDISAIEESENLFGAVKNNMEIKTVEELNEIKNKIEAILAPLEKVDKVNIPQNQKDKISELKKLVAEFSEELTNRQKAVEEYVKKGYDINEHIAFENDKIEDLIKSKASLWKRLSYAMKLKEIFENEYDEYSIYEDRAKFYDEIKNLISKYIENEAKIQNILKDNSKTGEQKSEEIGKLKLLENRKAYSTEITNKIDAFQKKYNIGLNIPDPETEREEFIKEAGNIISEMEKSNSTMMSNAKAKLDSKLEELKKSPELDSFCTECGINKDDIIKANTLESVKIILDKYYEYENKRIEINSEVAKRKQTIASLQELDRATANKDAIDSKTDNELLNSDEAKSSVNAEVNQKLTDAKLIDINAIKRRDLRKALKETVYQGKRFAGLRSGIRSIFKKSAMKLVTESYRATAQKQYVTATRNNATNQVDTAKTKRQEWAQQYVVKGAQQVLNGQKNPKAKVYEDMDRGL